MNIIHALPATLSLVLVLAIALLLNSIAGNAPLNAEPAPGASTALVIVATP